MVLALVRTWCLPLRGHGACPYEGQEVCPPEVYPQKVCSPEGLPLRKSVLKKVCPQESLSPRKSSPQKVVLPEDLSPKGLFSGDHRQGLVPYPSTPQCRCPQVAPHERFRSPQMKLSSTIPSLYG
ncbi:hypothetical protein PilKf_00721 [Pillotina sp. SPG140]